MCFYVAGGCFKCGKTGHISRECPDAAGKPVKNDSSLAFSSNGVLINPYTLKCCELIQQRLVTAEFTIFGDNSSAEFNELCRGIWHNLPRNNGVPAHKLTFGNFFSETFCKPEISVT